MWVRLDFANSPSRLVELSSTENLCEQVENKKVVQAKRQILMVQMPPQEDGKTRTGFILSSLVDPMRTVCSEEYINLSDCVSYGFVDTNSEMWNTISRAALGEETIVTPDKKLIV